KLRHRARLQRWRCTFADIDSNENVSKVRTGASSGDEDLCTPEHNSCPRGVGRAVLPQEMGHTVLRASQKGAAGRVKFVTITFVRHVCVRYKTVTASGRCLDGRFGN